MVLFDIKPDQYLIWFGNAEVGYGVRWVLENLTRPSIGIGTLIRMRIKTNGQLCAFVKEKFRRKGLMKQVVEKSMQYAFSQGAKVIEGYQRDIGQLFRLYI